jgi:hypothetical protein
VNKIKAYYNKLSNSAKAAIATGVFVFVSTVGSAFTGLLQAVIDWVNNGGPEPQWDAFGKIAFSAFLTLVIGLVNYVTRKVQQTKDPSSGPKY